jgi:hypothetical protein
MRPTTGTSTHCVLAAANAPQAPVECFERLVSLALVLSPQLRRLWVVLVECVAHARKQHVSGELRRVAEGQKVRLGRQAGRESKPASERGRGCREGKDESEACVHVRGQKQWRQRLPTASAPMPTSTPPASPLPPTLAPNNTTVRLPPTEKRARHTTTASTSHHHPSSLVARHPTMIMYTHAIQTKQVHAPTPVTGRPACSSGCPPPP